MKSDIIPVELHFIFRDSAFKHNLTEADTRHAFETCCYMDQYKNRKNVYLLLGFDMNANPVEILYNEFGGNRINVFHAMPCQKQFFHLFKRGNFMTEIEKETGMTDAECEYWDDYFTNNPYEPGPNLLKLGIKPGFASKILLLNELDKDVAEYLRLQAERFNKSRAQIINDLVHEKLAVGA